ncbi:MAG: hypothetical protein CMK24_07525 [Porticoccaceae bacterium]|nr:hypothetical protein [Porticoccaceae bacterium]|tara:strand:- start:1451 stop:1729 length:279 start_codon:yes stop_codon:yes gene_type:complete
MSEEMKPKTYTLALLIGWGLTLATVIWQVAVKDANYSLRLTSIESELESLDLRLDTAEEFRITLAANLAEIKTDLVWIRKELQEMSDREYNQ